MQLISVDKMVGLGAAEGGERGGRELGENESSNSPEMHLWATGVL